MTMNDLEYSVAMPQAVHAVASDHLLHHMRRGRCQEDVCLGLWHPSQGASRMSALVFQIILPEPHERTLHGNVGLGADYVQRAIEMARRHGAGVAILHNHGGPGWQGMSQDDVLTEQTRAAWVLAGTERPLLGMTLGTDGAWSARFWPRTAPKTYTRQWCRTVRVVGDRLVMTYHPELCPAPAYRDELRRSISVWGEKAQADLARLHVGVVGLGSVGRLVAESLARMGLGRVTLLDFDRVERHNLDRLLGAFGSDADQRRLKVEIAREGYLHAATAARPQVRAIPTSVVELEGAKAALDCDVLFSCVDRPWPRHVLNHLAYAHLIPVVDGGVVVRMRGTQFRGAEWSIRTVGPGRACLACAQTYSPALVEAERADLLDDPSYLQGLDPDHQLRRNENVFPFCMSVAAHEIIQFVAMATGLRNMPDFGDQRYHYNLGQMTREAKACIPDCEFCTMVASGETRYPLAAITGHHHAAARARANAPARAVAPPAPRRSIWSSITRSLCWWRHRK